MEKFLKPTAQEAISRREFLSRAKKAAIGVGATWALWNVDRSSATAQEGRGEQSIRERITSENKDIVFSFGAERQSSREDALIVIDWQEKFVGSRVNKDADVREQMRATEAKMIERIEEAKRKNIPIIVFGLSDVRTEKAKERLLASEDFLEENYPLAMRDALDGYEKAAYLAKRDNGVLGKTNQESTRTAIETILRENQVKGVRLVGTNESICVKWSAQELLYNERTGESFTVIVNPAELADSEPIIKKYDAREIYEILPRRALFLKLVDDYKRLRNEGTANQDAIDRVLQSQVHVAVDVFDKEKGDEGTRTVITPAQMDELKIFLETGRLPDYM